MALWNRENLPSETRVLCLPKVEEYGGLFDFENIMKEKYGRNYLREIGIDIVCYDEDNAVLKCPIKITTKEMELEKQFMLKTAERNTEFIVILQPRCKEYPPIFARGWAKDIKDAINGVFNPDLHESVLGIKETSDIEVNEDVCEIYWEMYGTYLPNQLEDVQYF